MLVASPRQLVYAPEVSPYSALHTHHIPSSSPSVIVPLLNLSGVSSSSILPSALTPFPFSILANYVYQGLPAQQNQHEY